MLAVRYQRGFVKEGNRMTKSHARAALEDLLPQQLTAIVESGRP